MKFSALNKESSNSSALSTPSSKKGIPTQEAQESSCLKLYHNAMQLQQEGKWEDAKVIYCEILESEIMEMASSSAEASASSTILRLKFLIFKNIASIAQEQGDLSAAADAYIEATSVDTTDITVWCQLASMASSLGNLLLARKALEQALCCHSDYWPAIESLCTVLLALGDFPSCLHTIRKGLDLDPHFPRGLVYLREIVTKYPEVVESQMFHLRVHLMSPQPEGKERFLEEAGVMSKRREALNSVVALRDPIVPTKNLSTLTIGSLATCLLSLYKHCKDLSQRTGSYAVPVDLSSFIDIHPTSQGSGASPPSGKEPSHIGAVLTGSASTCSDVVDAGRETFFQSDAAEGVVKMGSGEEMKGSGRRDAKRKLLDGPEVFTPKRRSTRMMTKRKDKEHKTYLEMLSKYLPPNLKIQEMPKISELSPLKKPPQANEDESVLSERKRQLSALIDSTPLLPEAEVVRRYIDERQNNGGVIHLLYQFVTLLSLRYDHKWSRYDRTSLTRTFVDIYESLHTHLSYPSPLCSPVEAQGEGFRDVAMVALCYVELYIDKKKKTQSSDSTSSYGGPVKSNRSFADCLVFVEQCSGMVGHSALEKLKYTLRVQWCVAKWHQFSSNHSASLQALTMCRDLLEIYLPAEGDSPKNLMIHLPNCCNGAVISLDHVIERIKELEQSVSFTQIKQLFDEKEYSLVVEKLQPFVDNNTSIQTEFLIGSKGHVSEATSLSLLLDSLLHLQSYHSCLQTAIQAALQLLQNYQMGSELWTSAVRALFRVVDTCLSEGVEEVKEECDMRLLKRLMVCVLRTMDVVYDMADSDLFLSMPIALPWKIFYTIISTDWLLSTQDEPMECTNSESVKGSPELKNSESIKGSPELITSESVKGSPELKAPTDVDGDGEPMEVMTGEKVTASQRSPDKDGSKKEGKENEEEEDDKRISRLYVPTPPSSPALSLILSSIEDEDVTAKKSQSPAPVIICSPSTSSSSSSSISHSHTRWGDMALPLQFLCEAHEHLGRMGWCCKDSGVFLIETVRVLREELRILTKLPPKQREILLKELEQCYYCLYGHPSKKARVRGLVEHNAEQIPLKWESALMLIEHYHPIPVPSIDDTKSPQVTAEVIALYKRIIDVLPDYGKVVSKENLERFIEGHSKDLEDMQSPHQHSAIMSEVYYILADDCLKSMDNHKAIRSYQENLCYSPNQFDSWAGLALGRSRIILEKLNQRDFKSGMEKYIRKHTPGTVVCFKKAISLNAKHCYIVEKFGFFCYAVQSFASQILHQPNLFVLSGIHPWASASRKEMLRLAETCFTQALSLQGTKHAEPWIYHWMLGKIGGKLTTPIKEILKNFIDSAYILHRDGAGYPLLVELSSKNHAVEALEVHYQLHSSALKHLLQFYKTFSSEQSKIKESESLMAEKSIAKALIELKNLPLTHQSYHSLWEWAKELFEEAFGARIAPPHPPVIPPPLSEVLQPLANASSTDIKLPPPPDQGTPTFSSASTAEPPPGPKTPTFPFASTSEPPPGLGTPTLPFASTSEPRPGLALPFASTSEPRPGLALPFASTSEPCPGLGTPTLPFASTSEPPPAPTLPFASTSEPHPGLGTLTLPFASTSGPPPGSEMPTLPFSSTSGPPPGPETPTLPFASISGSPVGPTTPTLPFASTSGPPVSSTTPTLPFASITGPPPSSETLTLPFANTTLPSELTPGPVTVAHEDGTLQSPGMEKWTPPSQGWMSGKKDLLDIVEEAASSRVSTEEMEVDNSNSNTRQSHDQSHGKESRTLQSHGLSHEKGGASGQQGYCKEVLQLCFYGVATCAVRCPAFFKALYRMAATLQAIGLPHRARELLLGPLPPALLKFQEKLQPLFVLKSNIFTNMWQILTEEINRPGSFSSHARRNLELLSSVLEELKEPHSLLHLAQHLKSKPDATKRYLRDNERIAIHKKIVKLCVRVLVKLSKEDKLSFKEAEKHKSTAVAVRSMANRLENDLIKELDEAITCFQEKIEMGQILAVMDTGGHVNSTDHMTLITPTSQPSL